MTGIPWSSAFWIGSLNASGSTTATAMPSAPPEMAVFISFTISWTTESSEPVHCDVVPSSACASSMPYCVGTKNGFVVTWLMKTKLYSGVSGKLPPDPPDPPPPWLACCASGLHPLINSPAPASALAARNRSEEHTSELQSRQYLVCRLLLEKKKKQSTSDALRTRN